MTILDDVATHPPLSAAMREGSRAEHEATEGSTFMTELLAGRVAGPGYAEYLRRLRCVYEALETTRRALALHPAVRAVHDPALDRLDAIDADLDHWAPGETRATASAAAEAYAARIRTAEDDPLRFVAHQYTRYLGDLSGGQAIGRILDRAHHLDGAGTAFYAFPGIPEPKPWKDAYRARLDALDLPASDVAQVVAEVKVAFGLNQALFSELGRGLGVVGSAPERRRSRR